MTTSPEPAAPRPRPGWRFVFGDAGHLIAFGFGSGLSPFAPGTAGSAAAVPLYLLLAYWLTPLQIILLSIPLFLVGIWICDRTGRAIGIADYGGIVWDEIVAMFFILATVPHEPFWWAAAFFVFRLFDIWKPFPIRTLDERLANGFGVMLDDLLAAVYSIAVLRLLIRWL